MRGAFNEVTQAPPPAAGEPEPSGPAKLEPVANTDAEPEAGAESDDPAA
jgi:hypothetical protein